MAIETSEQQCLSLIATKVASLENIYSGKVPNNESMQDLILDLSKYTDLLYSLHKEKLEASKNFKGILPHLSGGDVFKKDCDTAEALKTSKQIQDDNAIPYYKAGDKVRIYASQHTIKSITKNFIYFDDMQTSVLLKTFNNYLKQGLAEIITDSEYDKKFKEVMSVFDNIYIDITNTKIQDR